MQPCANNRGGAARGPTDKGRSSQPNVLTIKRDRVTGIDFKRTPYNDILKQLSSALEKGNFSSFSHTAAVALLYQCGKSKCMRFPEGLIPLVVLGISFSDNENGAKAIGNAVYGLQNLDGSQKSTRDLVAALAPKITGKATCSWGDISDHIVGVSNGGVDTCLAHAELIACAHKNPALFREPLGVKSLIETGRLYHHLIEGIATDLVIDL